MAHNEVHDEQKKLTPMVEQYQRIKAEYPDALLFYRMGDFYELFFSDAVTAARELQIALTSRNKAQGNDIPMCGVPWHAAKSYIAQLIDKGYVVAICEQTEDPKNKSGRGLVKRAVTQVITPGTVLDDANLEATSANYLGAILQDGTTWAFVWADISTGHWTGAEFGKEEDLWHWVYKMGPRELLLPEGCVLPKHRFFDNVHIVRQHGPLSLERATNTLCQAQHVRDLESLGLQKKPLLVCVCAHLVRYLEQTQKCAIDQLAPFEPINLSRRMLIDDTTERNLELFACFNGSKGRGTLRALLRTTVTPMGGRTMEDMLHHPWRELDRILAIQEMVRFFLADDDARAHFREELASICDLERIIQRISLNRASPKDYIVLRESLVHLPAVKALLAQGQAEQNNATIAEILNAWDSLEDCQSLLARALVADPPAVITDGGLFCAGYSQELDELLDIVDHAQQRLDEQLAQERERTGISKLKLGYNRVFGYYYEISNAVSCKIPEHFKRCQSVMNAERFSTESLKKLEEAILQASEKQKTLEYTLFQELRTTVAGMRERLLAMSDMLAQLDYWQALAQVGRVSQWTMPTFLETPELDLTAARHPVLEQVVGKSNVVPNDIRLSESRSFCLLTGPNMAGKSTILRQTAICCILAQMGSMVPASSAKLGLVDKIFSRVGASDNLVQGESTFMVEMKETARILRQATKNSLVVFDEIGRGTSTYDGVALAWAIVEHIVKRAEGKTRTLFATHYHELLELEGRIPSLFTMNVAIREYNGTIVFLHKLIPGPTDKSYGVDVARLAGIPSSVVARAREVLARLESGKKSMQDLIRTTAQELLPGIQPMAKSAKPVNQPETQALKKKQLLQDQLLQELAGITPEHMSPMEALTVLTDWKQRFSK